MLQNLLHLITLFAQTSPARPGGDFSFADVPYLILGILICAVVVGVSTNLWDQQERDRKRQRAAGTDTPPRPSPVVASAPVMQQLPARDPLPDRDDLATQPPPNLVRLTAAERRHTIVVGSEGDGKTQTQIAFLVADIARGTQVVWASTNLALYHSRDQQTDLRPIAHLFESTRDRIEIMAVLQWASAEVERRMPFYHADEPHGDPVVIYVDELGGLYRAFGETLVAAMRNIAEQGRKVDVFLFLVAHNALKDGTGLDSALKPLFKTRLLGNVDQFTWTALVGPGIKLRGVPDGQGIWQQPDKRGNVFAITIRRPSAQDIARFATMQPQDRRSILDAAQPYRERLVGGTDVTSSPGMPALPASPAVWAPTELHGQVRELIDAALPEIIRMITQEGLSLPKAQELTQTSNRALARRLGLGANGGSGAVRVADAIKDWEREGGVRLFAVPAPPPDDRFDRSERAERLERPEHITPAA